MPQGAGEGIGTPEAGPGERPTPVALVTGAGRRLGAALALGAGGEGYDVAVHFHGSVGGARRTAARLEASGRRAALLRADLRRREEIPILVEGVRRELGRLDLLVNSAAIFPLAPWVDLSPEIWDEVLAVNLTAPFLLTRAAVPLLRESGGGRIVNIVDLGAFEAWIDRPANGVAKAGLLKLTQSLARELGPEILVNAIAPGSIALTAEPGPAPLPSPRRLPLRRWGTAEDVVEALRFLLRTRYATGTCVVVDGGQLLL